MIMIFATSDFLAHESGLLAVTVMGIWLGNMKDVAVSEILSFKESLSVLIISVLFIVLGARVDPMDILATAERLAPRELTPEEKEYFATEILSR